MQSKKEYNSNERIPFHKPIKTPLVLKSTLKLKENLQERKSHSTAKRNGQQDSMKGKHFGSLDIVITRRKPYVEPVPMKKRKGGQNKFIDKMSFPEDLDDSFHQGLLSDDESGFENTISDVPKKRNQKEACKSPQPSKVPRTDKGSNFLVSKRLCSSQKASIQTGNDLPLSQEFSKLQLIKERQTGREFMKTNNSCGTEKTSLPKTPKLSQPEGHLPSVIPEKFKILETPFIPKLPFIPETPSVPGSPQHEFRLRHLNGKECTAVPETPLLYVSSMPVENYHRHPPRFHTQERPVKSGKRKDTRLSCSNKHRVKRQLVQVVPETPYLKFKSSDELSLYD